MTENGAVPLASIALRMHNLLQQLRWHTAGRGLRVGVMEEPKLGEVGDETDIGRETSSGPKNV